MNTHQTTSNETWLRPSAALKRLDFLREASIGDARVSESESRVRYGVWLNRIGLLIPPHTPSEVMDEMPIYPLPNTADWFSGLCNLRGNIIPVYDLVSLFGFRKGSADKHYLLVLDKGERAVGMLAKALPQLRVIDEHLTMANRPPIPQHLEAHVSKAYIIDQKVWLDFDHEGFFGAIGRAGSPL